MFGNNTSSEPCNMNNTAEKATCDCRSFVFDGRPEGFREAIVETEHTVEVQVLGVTVKLLVSVYRDDYGRIADPRDDGTMREILDSVEWLGDISSHDPEFVHRVQVREGFHAEDADLVYEVENWDGGCFECISGPDEERALDLLAEKRCEIKVLGYSSVVTAHWEDNGYSEVCIRVIGGQTYDVETPDWDSFTTLVAALECGTDETVKAFPYCKTTIGEALEDWFDE